MLSIFFEENRSQLLVIDYYCKKALSQMFERVLNAPQLHIVNYTQRHSYISFCWEKFLFSFILVLESIVAYAVFDKGND